MKLTAFLAAMLLATAAQAQQASATASTSSGWTFALHGFASMSTGYQTGSFSFAEGQKSLLSTTGRGLNDTGSWTADVRQSRFNFSVKGPQVLGGATPSAVLEIDFFDEFGGGNYGDVSLLPRMRVAYSQLDWGAGKLQAGQQNDLVFAMAPTSLSHIAFPLGYFTGNIGWRRPGLFGYYTFAASDLKLEVAGEVGRAQTADAAAAVGNGFADYAGGIQPGEASGGPAVEGRVALAYSKYLNAFVATHYNNTDATGYGNFGNAAANGTGAVNVGGKSTFQTVAVNGGLKLSFPLPNDMGLVVQGTGFTGKNLAPLIADLSAAKAAFFPLNGVDIHTHGWWAQAGLNLTKEFSLWAFYGMQNVDEGDFVKADFAAAGGPYQNTTTNVIAMYRDGGYGFSAEWINFQSLYATATNATTDKVTAHRTATSNQYLFTANYFF